MSRKSWCFECVETQQTINEVSIVCFQDQNEQELADMDVTLRDHLKQGGIYHIKEQHDQTEEDSIDEERVQFLQQVSLGK